MKRNVLGKGIAAIISNEPLSTPATTNQLVEVDTDAIYPNPFQPRKAFSSESIQELADSIRESGMIQPLVLFKRDAKYYLIVGERRWRAAQLLKWNKVPAIVRDVDDNEVMVEALVENIQREDLNAIEVAEGIEALIEKMGLNHQQVAEKLGMNRTTVSNFLRLLRLPTEAKQLVIGGTIDQGHARALLSLQSEEDILSALQRVAKQGLSVRQTEQLVKNFYKEKKTAAESQPDPDISRMESKITKLLSTEVHISCAKSGKGKMEIHFSSLEEFERIWQLMAKEQAHA